MAKQNPNPAFAGPQGGNQSSTRYVLIGTKGVFQGANTWSKDVKDSTAEVYPTFDIVRVKEHIKRLKNEGNIRGEHVSLRMVKAKPDRGFNITVEEFERQKLDTVVDSYDETEVEGVEAGETEGEEKPAKRPSRRKKKTDDEE